MSCFSRAIDILESYFSIDGETYSYQLNFNARNSDGPVLRTYDLPLRSSVVCKAIKLIFQMPRGRLLLSEVEFYNGKQPWKRDSSLICN